MRQSSKIFRIPWGLAFADAEMQPAQPFSSAAKRYVSFPGNETHLLDTLEKGCAGCISATANANPHGIRKIFDSCLSGDSTVHALQEQAFAIREVFGRHPLVSALKQHAAWSSGEDAWLRLRPPLTPLDNKAAAMLRSDLDALTVPPS